MMKSASRNANETPTLKFVVTCVPGLERLLSDELAEMGILEVEADGDEKHPTGALRFAGSWADAAKVLVGSRLASRLLLELREFAAVNADMLYDQVRRVKWADYMRPGRTLAVFAHGKSPGRDLVLSFAALKIKDAVCDEIRKHGVDRPDVDRENPDIRLEAHFQEGRCRLSLDLSGAPLHRRGQRTEAGEAPLRENRAAALLRLVGLRAGAEGLFVDPFCGSGTILLEAAAIAENRAPGLVRRAREFKGALFSMELEAALEAELVRASKAVVPLKLRLEGRDVESRQLEKAKRNLRGGADPGAPTSVNATSRRIGSSRTPRTACASATSRRRPICWACSRRSSSTPRLPANWASRSP